MSVVYISMLVVATFQRVVATLFYGAMHSWRMRLQFREKYRSQVSALFFSLVTKKDIILRKTKSRLVKEQNCR